MNPFAKAVMERMAPSLGRCHSVQDAFKDDEHTPPLFKDNPNRPAPQPSNITAWTADVIKAPRSATVDGLLNFGTATSPEVLMKAQLKLWYHMGKPYHVVLDAIPTPMPYSPVNDMSVGSNVAVVAEYWYRVFGIPLEMLLYFIAELKLTNAIFGDAKFIAIPECNRVISLPPHQDAPQIMSTDRTIYIQYTDKAGNLQQTCVLFFVFKELGILN